jgi:hypothetical protein
MTGFGAEIGARLRERRALVGIVGLGYVGLPLALGFAEPRHVAGRREAAGGPGLGQRVAGNVVERPLAAGCGSGGHSSASSGSAMSGCRWR